MPPRSFRLLPDLANPSQKVCYGTRDPQGDPLEVNVQELVIRKDIGVESGSRCLNIYGGRSRDYVLRGWKEELQLERVHLSGGWSNPMTAESNLMRRLRGDANFSSRTAGDVIEGLKDEVYRPPIWFNYPLAWQELWAKELRQISDRYLADTEKSIVTQVQDVAFEMKARKVLKPMDQMQIGELLKLGAPTFWDTRARSTTIGKATSGPFDQAFGYGFFVSEDGVEFEGYKTDLIISNVTGARGLDTTGVNLWLIHALRGQQETEDAYLASAEAVQADAQSKGKSVSWDTTKNRDYAKGFARTCEPVTDLAHQILEKYPEADGMQLAMQSYVKKGLPKGVSLFPPTEPQAFVKEVSTDDAGIEHVEWKEVDVLELEA